MMSRCMNVHFSVTLLYGLCFAECWACNRTTSSAPAPVMPRVANNFMFTRPEIDRMSRTIASPSYTTKALPTTRNVPDLTYDDHPLVRGRVTPALLRTSRRALLLHAVADRVGTAPGAGDDPLQVYRQAWEAARYPRGVLENRRRSLLQTRQQEAHVSGIVDPAMAPDAGECPGGFSTQSLQGAERTRVVECGQTCRDATCEALIQFYRVSFNASMPWHLDFGACVCLHSTSVVTAAICYRLA